MSQPVNLSDDIVRDAQAASQLTERSIEAQIELWAQLGRAIAPLLDETRALALLRAGSARPLSECLAAAGTDEGRKRLAAYLASRPFPHYEPAAEQPELLVRIEEDGARKLGRFIGRDFQAVDQ